jgi:hypothetical protein
MRNSRFEIKAMRVSCNLESQISNLESRKETEQVTIKETRGTATVRFFDGLHDPLTFFGPAKGLDAKMRILEPYPAGGGLGLGEVVHQWEE